MSGPIGVGVGDFLAIGRIVIKTVQTFRESKSSITRFQRLEHRIATLEQSLIGCRESNSGIELPQQSRDVRNGVSDMSLALGSCEEAIVRFRKEMEGYKGLLQGEQTSCKGVRRVKEMFATAGKKMTFTGDLEAALARFEEDLRMNLMCYEMNSRRINRLISARKHQQHSIHLDGVSKKLAEVSIDVGKLKHMMEALLSEQQKMGRAIMRCSNANGDLCLAISTSINHTSSPESIEEDSDREFVRALNSLASEGMKALRRNSDSVMLPLLALLLILVRYLRLCWKVLPRELGYIWDSETGYRMSITILDPIGRTLSVPQELCSSIQTLHGVIELYFRGNQGHGKVARGEYCLARSSTDEGYKRILTEVDLFLARTPGSKIPMYMKVQNRKFVKHSEDLLRSGEGVSLCPQCGTLNYPSKRDRNLISCIGCSSEVRIFLDDSVQKAEESDEVPPSISETILQTALEDFNGHGTECSVCRDPMRAYFLRKPLCPVGHNLSQPIRDEFEHRRRHVIQLGRNSNTPITIPNAEGPAEDLICVLNTISGSGYSPGGVFSAEDSGLEESENVRYLRVFTVARAAPGPQIPRIGQDSIRVRPSFQAGVTRSNQQEVERDTSTEDGLPPKLYSDGSTSEKSSPLLQQESIPEKSPLIHSETCGHTSTTGRLRHYPSAVEESTALSSFLKSLSLYFSSESSNKAPASGIISNLNPSVPETDGTTSSRTDSTLLTAAAASAPEHLLLPQPHWSQATQPTSKLIPPIPIPKPSPRQRYDATVSTTSSRLGWRPPSTSSRRQTPRSISSTTSSASLLSCNPGRHCYSPANTLASNFHTPQDTGESFNLSPCSLKGLYWPDQKIQSERPTEPNQHSDPFKVDFKVKRAKHSGKPSLVLTGKQGCNKASTIDDFCFSGMFWPTTKESDSHGSPRQIYHRSKMSRRTGLEWDEDGGMFVYSKRERAE